MPEISVSDSLYRQIASASDGDDIDETMWKMVAHYSRGNNPGD
jgi:hypothetical protein